MNSDFLSQVIAKRIRPDVQAMHAYVVQDASGMVKLDAMENPYSLPPALQSQLGARLAGAALNRYPSTEPQQLQAALRAYTGLGADYGLILGNGSDELISLISSACSLPGATVLAPVPGFVMYGISAQLAQMQFVGVPLTPDFELDEAAMLAAIAQHQPAITWLAYPNNPTANAWSKQSIARIIAAVAAVQGIVVMDEAYQPFATHSWLTELQAQPALHQHVLIMRTLSKFGLAGIRLGFLMGAERLVAEIDKVRPPYNVNVLTAEAALFALEHSDEFARQAAQICSERTRLLADLATLKNCHAYPSQANMILLRVPDAAQTFTQLKERGVLIKNVSSLHPLLANCVRLTVGTPNENTAMLAALAAVLT